MSESAAVDNQPDATTLPPPSEDQPTVVGETEDGEPGEPVIDPELADLPAPPHHNSAPNSTNGNGNSKNDEQTAESATAADALATSGGGSGSMSITESIASAPNPRPADFSMLPLTTEDVDLSALDTEDGPPGSPTAKLLRAIAPPNAAQLDSKWPPPPPNASVNLFIGRALLSNGNDNWPLKPNDIVNWIRKHYPAEWDGDEGRCSAHRVRTYLARKGADMYYEKLNQGCIAGWRIRQNHLWRFENGGFLGRGMKQEEAIAAAAKENEAIATAAHKAAAAEALAAGHPGVKVSMSQPGVNDGLPPPKRQRVKASGQARRRNNAKTKADDQHLDQLDVSLASAAEGDSSFYQPSPHSHAHDAYNPSASYENHNHNHAGPSNDHNSNTTNNNGEPIDPTLMSATSGDGQVDIDMVQRAMQAAGQIDEFEMGLQLPIEMQHGAGEHEDEHLDGTNNYYGAAGVGVGVGGAGNGTGTDQHHPYTPHGYQGAEYGFGTGGEGQVYGQYEQGQ